MNLVRPYLLFLHAATLCLLSAMPAFAGPIDDYYLAHYAEQIKGSVKSASLEADAEESASCGTPLKRALQRDWELLEASTQKVLAKQLALPTLSGEKTYTSSSGNFRIHYAASGTDAPPSASSDGNTPDWVKTVADTLEDVRSYYHAQGYKLPQTAVYEVYLRDLAGQGLYGLTNSGDATPSTGYPNAFSSWIELDNNFTDSIYKPSQYTALQSLRITAAHEFQHSIQYAYNYYFDIWYAEATSSWFEDEIYDDVNQLYNYPGTWFRNSKLALDASVSTTNGSGYGRWIFNRYLAEKHGSGVIKSFWEKLAGTAPTGTTDIPMAPVIDSVLSTSYSSTLGNDFFGFAKRVYKRDWATHQPELNLIPAYSPISTITSYPVSATSVTLPHYSFAYYKFIPSASALPDLPISINGTSGITASVFKSIGGVITEIKPEVNSNTFTITGFNKLNSSTDEVVLLLANTGNVDNQSASFDTTPGTFSQVKGDVNNDSKIDIFDALLTLQYGLNLIPHDATSDAIYLAHGDVAPLETATLKPKGDGKIDIMDALVILQRSVNLLSW